MVVRATAAIAHRIKSLLYPLCVVAGLCYGSMFSLVLALTGDLFGAEHIGTNYGLLDLGTHGSENMFRCLTIDGRVINKH